MLLTSWRTLPSDHARSRLVGFAARRLSPLFHQSCLKICVQLDDNNQSVRSWVWRYQFFDSVCIRWIGHVPHERENEVQAVGCAFFNHAPAKLVVQRVERRRAVSEYLDQRFDRVVVMEQPELTPFGDLSTHGHLSHSRRADDQDELHGPSVPEDSGGGRTIITLDPGTTGRPLSCGTHPVADLLRNTSTLSSCLW